MIRVGALLMLICSCHRAGPQPEKSTARSTSRRNFNDAEDIQLDAGSAGLRPAVDKTIVSAIDSEMLSLGLKKADRPAADVTIRYLAVRSTSVDLEKLEEIEKQEADKAGADVTVGRLVIVHGGCEVGQTGCGRRTASSGSIRRPPSVTRRSRAGRTRMFETYPTRARNRLTYFGELFRQTLLLELLDGFLDQVVDEASKVFGFLVSLTAAHSNWLRGTL